MKIVVTNAQKVRTPNKAEIRKLVERLLARLRHEGQPVLWTEISIVLTDNAGIQTLNRQFLGKSEPTDVLSFRYPPVPGETPAYDSAELIVNVERAAEWTSASAYPRRKTPAGTPTETISRELALYLAHACDHLTGADDATPSDRRRMRSREWRWLRALEHTGLPRRLLQNK